MKKIPWWEPRIGKKEYLLINKVLRNHFPNEGKLTEEFEQKIAGLLGVKHAVAVTNGTAAIFLSLKALGIGKGDEVIVPDMTFIATANAVALCGAKAVLADVDIKTMTLDTKSFERAITPKTKAVIPVHVSGRAANLIEIGTIAKKQGVLIVEDAAEAFMSKYKGKYLGTYGTAGCFSFSPAKIITTGQGGLIVTNSDKIYKSLKELKDQGRPTRGTGGDDIHHSIGYNFKFTDLQAAVGLGQLSYVKARMKRMWKINELYRKYLLGLKEITLFAVDRKNGELPLWTDCVVEKRDEICVFLKSKNVDCRKFWFPIHSQNPYKLSDKFFPNSIELSPKALWLPSAFTMKDSDVKYVCNTIKQFFTHEKSI